MTASGTAMEHALELVQGGRLDEAEIALRRLAGQGALPSAGVDALSRLLYNRAVAAATSDLATAETLLREAITLAPGFLTAANSLAEVLLRRAGADLTAGKWESAVVAATEAAGLWPAVGMQLTGATSALVERLRLAAVERTPTQPVVAARLALAGWRLLPGADEIYATCRSLFVHLGVGGLGPPVAAVDFESALARDPADVVALLGLANIRRQARRLHLAEKLCRHALVQSPGNPFALGRLASVLTSATRYREADRLYQTIGRDHGGIESVIRLAPDFFEQLRLEPHETEASTEIAAADPDRMVVFAGCDVRYFHRFADALANSIAESNSPHLLHLHVVNPDGGVAGRIAAMQKRLPALSIACTTEQTQEGWDADALRTYFACARFLMLPALLRRYRRPILMLDVDVVVLRDPKPLLDQLRAEAADFAMVRGEQQDPWCTYWADAILALPTPSTLEYFDRVRDYLRRFLSQNRGIWFLDQVALFAAYVAGFAGRPRPQIVEWPADIQNSDTTLAYFWSLHISQPSNASLEESPLFRRFLKGRDPNAG